jgi:hypothetical protein
MGVTSWRRLIKPGFVAVKIPRFQIPDSKIPRFQKRTPILQQDFSSEKTCNERFATVREFA